MSYFLHKYMKVAVTVLGERGSLINLKKKTLSLARIYQKKVLKLCTYFREQRCKNSELNIAFASG